MIKLVKHGVYNGYNYFVLPGPHSYNGYAEIDEHTDIEDLCVHGEITFKGDLIVVNDETVVLVRDGDYDSRLINLFNDLGTTLQFYSVVGFDTAHFGDFIDDNELTLAGNKWSSEDVFNETFQLVKQIESQSKM